jgi:hypothetical protein
MGREVSEEERAWWTGTQKLLHKAYEACIACMYMF